MHSSNFKSIVVVVCVGTGCGGAGGDSTANVEQGVIVRTIVPAISAVMQARLQAVYASGLASGNREDVFSKVGDSITATGSFLMDIGCSVETLGAHADLESTINFFRATSFPAARTSSWCGVGNSFSIDSVAATEGWTTADVLSPASDPGCPAPYSDILRCELHLTHPSVALIMLGTNDLQAINDLTVYHTNLTTIVTETLAAGVIPVLSTIPPRLDSSIYGARVVGYNAAITAVATAQQIPLWDYALALNASTMIHQGVGDDGVHPNIYNGEDGANFTTDALRYGYNQRNLTAVQVLAHLKAVIFDNGPPDNGAAPDAGSDAVADIADVPALDAGTDALPDVSSDDVLDVPANGGGPDAGSSDRIVPAISDAMQARLQAVYASGRTAGNREGVFSKIGDSITATGSFLVDISCSVETLGAETNLEPTINFFRATTFPASWTSSWCGVANAFSIDSVAAAEGWTTADVLSPAGNSACPAPYSDALQCELHLTRPSVALIMLGTNDLQAINDLTVYQANLTSIVTETLAAGVIPVLSSIPARLDSSDDGALVAAYNAAIATVAAAQQIPLWDYHLALSAPTMIHQGVGDDGVHPNIYNGEDGANFSIEALQYGYNQRNLTAVQVLAHIKAVVFDNGTPD